MDSTGTARKITVICVHPSSVQHPHIFNPNDWEQESKAVVFSCSAEYSVLNYVIGRIAELCRSSRQRCQRNFEELYRQWRDSPWDAGKCSYYSEDPELHSMIEAFFSGVKSLLDLIVQLIATEGIVAGCKVDGFHRDSLTYGGRVLNCLENNAVASKRQLAGEISTLIKEHKKAWIDEAIQARDQLVHPNLGVPQLMFYLDLEVRDSNLVYKDAMPPVIANTRIDAYATSTLEHIKLFAIAFLEKLRASRTGT